MKRLAALLAMIAALTVNAQTSPPITYKVDSTFQQEQPLPDQAFVQGAGVVLRYSIKNGSAWWPLAGLGARWDGRASGTSTQALQAVASVVTNVTPNYFQIALTDVQTGSAVTNWLYRVIVTSGGRDYPLGAGRLDIAASAWTGAAGILTTETAQSYTDAAVSNHAATVATTNSLGHVIAGSGISVDGNGRISTTSAAPAWGDVTGKPAWASNAVLDHATGSNLHWTASGHTGTPARIAGFLEGGYPGYIPIGAGLELDGSDNLNVSNSIITGAAAGATWGSYSNSVLGHVASTSNPHGVTAAQAGALADGDTNVTLHLAEDATWSGQTIEQITAPSVIYYMWGSLAGDIVTAAGTSRLARIESPSALSASTNTFNGITNGYLTRGITIDPDENPDTLNEGVLTFSITALRTGTAADRTIRGDVTIYESNGVDVVAQYTGSDAPAVPNDIPTLLPIGISITNSVTIKNLGRKIFVRAIAGSGWTGAQNLSLYSQDGYLTRITLPGGASGVFASRNAFETHEALSGAADAHSMSGTVALAAGAAQLARNNVFSGNTNTFGGKVGFGGTTNPFFSVDSVGTIRSSGPSLVVGATGKGVEMFLNGTNGFIISYDRDTSVYLPFEITGNPLHLNRFDEGSVTVPNAISGRDAVNYDTLQSATRTPYKLTYATNITISAANGIQQALTNYTGALTITWPAGDAETETTISLTVPPRGTNAYTLAAGPTYYYVSPLTSTNALSTNLITRLWYASPYGTTNASVTVSGEVAP